MGVKPEDIDRAIANGNKCMAQLKQVCPKPGEQPVPVKSKRIRQNTKGPNKLEREAMEYLKPKAPWMKYSFHSIRFVLGNGVTYTPDIIAFNEKTRAMNAIEVKGKKMWDDAVVKLKIAARVWPNIDWGIVWKEKGVWNMQKVLP